MAGLKIQNIFRCVIRELKIFSSFIWGFYYSETDLPFLLSFLYFKWFKEIQGIKNRQGEKPEDQELYTALLLFPHVPDLLSHSSPGNKKKPYISLVNIIPKYHTV